MGIIKKWINRLTHQSAVRGRQGEEQICEILTRSTRFRCKGKLLHNLYIPRGNEETTEIDVLYITKKGLFVIESKNYSGCIFGHSQQPNWTVSLYTGKKNWWGKTKMENHSFYNPIVQNKTHIHFLKKYVKDDVQTFSFIVFSQNATLKDVTVSEPDVVVCRQQELMRRMKKLWWRRPNTLSKDEVNALYQQLLPLAGQKKSVQKKHIRDVKKRTAHAPICPQCGAKLVLRCADTPQPFYGCERYPKCQYTRKLWQS